MPAGPQGAECGERFTQRLEITGSTKHQLTLKVRITETASLTQRGRFALQVGASGEGPTRVVRGARALLNF
jgi:hypothetical protein